MPAPAARMTLSKATKQVIHRRVLSSPITRLLSTANTSGTQASAVGRDEQHEKAIAEKAVQAAVQHSTTIKTQAQLDEELRQKMMGLAGDGGEAGIEYEDGKPVAMKRSVKDNMFRYI